MKKYRYIFLLILGLSVTGCSDLKEEPIGLLAPEAYYNDIGSLEVAVNAAYGFVHDRFFLVRETGMALMLRGDMVTISDPGTRQERIDHDEFTDLDDNGNTAVAWPAMWKIVSATNSAIAGAKLLTEEDQSEVEATVAPAYFLRAFAYYHIVRQFGAVPYIIEPVSDVAAASNVEKASVATIYEGIIGDLTFAKTHLPDQVTNRSLASKAAASAYLASVYMTTEDWQNAFDEAKEIIDNASTYDLALDADYQNLWRYDMVNDSKEPIFNLDYIGNVGLGDPNTDYIGPLSGIRGNEAYAQGTGWAVMAPSLAVYETWDGQDYRRAVSIDTTGVFDLGDDNGPQEIRFDDTPIVVNGEAVTREEDDGTITTLVGWNAADSRNHSGEPFIAKYNRYLGEDFGGSGRASEQNYQMMRYAEVLLIGAEAAVEIGDNAAALNYINQVRARARNAGSSSVDPAIQAKYPASTQPADLAGTVTIDDVLEERRLELAFEMKRWYDIVRRDLGPTVFGASGLEGAKDNFTSGNDYLIAIPSDEQDRNPNLADND